MPKRKKFDLSQLKVESFVTSLNAHEEKDILGRGPTTWSEQVQCWSEQPSCPDVSLGGTCGGSWGCSCP